MAGSNERGSEEQYVENTGFVWDENSNLYYHASTGFYHDPVGGWYYSSKDGLYYKFENGSYVLLESDQGVDYGTYSCDDAANNDCVQEECYGNGQSDKIVESEANKEESNLDGPISDDLECVDKTTPQNAPPPSEWLEDTLIELYLSGYSNQAATTSDNIMLIQPDDMDHIHMPADGTGENDSQEFEDGELQSDDKLNPADSSGNVLDEGATSDEERWRAQYGQATHRDEHSASNIHLVDLWDWTTVDESRKHGEIQVTRLIGRLVKRSKKLHPSVASGGRLLKTAPICEVCLDLVRVTSGQIYRLRSPSAKYLGSTSTFDSSNPTKDWAFPQLSISEQSSPYELGGTSKSRCIEGLSPNQGKSLFTEGLLELKKSNIYRDRAAERRSLHGGFGVGPGQKKSRRDSDSVPSSPTGHPEEAVAESLNLSFGAGSYGRKLLESMGWKEGQALGGSMKGLTEPLQAVGNKGNAGIGWDRNRT